MVAIESKELVRALHIVLESHIHRVCISEGLISEESSAPVNTLKRIESKRIKKESYLISTSVNSRQLTGY